MAAGVVASLVPSASGEIGWIKEAGALTEPIAVSVRAKSPDRRSVVRIAVCSSIRPQEESCTSPLEYRLNAGSQR
jgi:hypothetical protein